MSLCKNGHNASKDPSSGWCSECRRVYKRNYYHQHREVMLKNSNKYNSEHVIEKRLYTKLYYQSHLKNKDSRNASNSKRRALKLASLGSFNQKDIKRILIEQNFNCNGCKSNITNTYSIDHIIPLSRGGSNLASNIQLLCISCNCQKRHLTMAEWTEKRNALG